MGRIEPRKQQLQLVEALARVRQTHPNARLELVGPIADAAYAERVRHAIARHRLADAVTLTGRIRDVAARVRKWDLFVSLSSDEGQGLAVQEAMALGVNRYRTGQTFPQGASQANVPFRIATN